MTKWRKLKVCIFKFNLNNFLFLLFSVSLRLEEQISHLLGGWGQRWVPGPAVGRGSRLVIGRWQRSHLPAEAWQLGSAHAYGEILKHWLELSSFFSISIQPATKEKTSTLILLMFRKELFHLHILSCLKFLCEVCSDKWDRFHQTVRK